MKLDDLIEVLAAAKAGRTIQFRPFTHGTISHQDDWADMPDPLTWDWSGCEYRIKPE